MRRALWVAALALGCVIACAKGETLEDVGPLQADINDSGTGQTSDGFVAQQDAGGRDSSLRDVDLSDVSLANDGPLADVTFNPDAAQTAGSCPNTSQLDFFLYYFEALDELSGDSPEMCPCQTAGRCCFAGLVCVAQ